MRVIMMMCVLLVFAVGSVGMYSSGLSYAADAHKSAHKQLTGVVTQKAGALFIKTEEGTTYQLNENQQKRHGHDPFKEGDHVTFVLDENNTVIDAHLAGQAGKHRFVTGKLVHVGKMKQEIKLQTPQGEQVFPLLHQETKTKALEEGTQVTVELNEAGTVIDLHRADEHSREKK
jgi:hypothetical protein